MKEEKAYTITGEPIQSSAVIINTECWISVLLHHSEIQTWPVLHTGNNYISVKQVEKTPIT